MMKTIKLEIDLTYDAVLMHGNEPDGIEWFNRAVIGPEAELCLHENASLGDDVGTVLVVREIDDSVDGRIADLVGYFLGENHKAWPPSSEEAEADMRTLTAQIKATIHDWTYAKWDGERD